MIVDIRWTRTLEDKHVLVPHARIDLDARLQGAEFADVAWREGDPESVGDVVGESVVRVACEEGESTAVASSHRAEWTG